MPSGLPLVFAWTFISFLSIINILPVEADETNILSLSSKVIPSGWGIVEEISSRFLGKFGCKWLKIN